MIIESKFSSLKLYHPLVLVVFSGASQNASVTSSSLGLLQIIAPGCVCSSAAPASWQGFRLLDLPGALERCRVVTSFPGFF